MSTSFESHGRQYAIDDNGAVHQTDPKRFIYDQKYVGIYDTPEYLRQSEILQAMRLGFTLAAHGYTDSRPSLLDYGYGNGAFLKFASKHLKFVFGHDIAGVELPGIKTFDNLNELEFVDIITFWDCLEHIHDLSFLQDLRCETVIVSLPWCHIRKEGKAWFDQDYHHRKPDEHVHHFDRNSLLLTMAAHGWKMVAVSTHEDIVRVPKNGLPNILTAAFKRAGENGHG